MPSRRCWAEIDPGALRHNLAVVKERLGPHCAVMAVVKANGYGHGMPAVVRALEDSVAMFGVANVTEAMELHEVAPGAAVFVLGPALPDERSVVVANRFVPALSSIEEARSYARLVEGEPLSVHLALDTGMGRIGIWQEESESAAREIASLPGLQLTGLATHLPVADEDESFTTEQLQHFEQIVARLQASGIDAPVVHALNSAGVIRFPTSAGTMARAGLMLYGSSPLPDFQTRLRPVMTWKSRITLLRDVGAGRGISYGRTFITPGPMRIATLAVGYADGYPRHLSASGASVLIRGRRCPLLGRVTMDQIMVDVSALPDAAVGDEAVLMGSQGGAEILASELAERAGTIAWEIFTGVGARVPRVIADCRPVPACG